MEERKKATIACLLSRTNFTRKFAHQILRIVLSGDDKKRIKIVYDLAKKVRMQFIKMQNVKLPFIYIPHHSHHYLFPVSLKQVIKWGNPDELSVLGVVGHSERNKKDLMIVIHGNSLYEMVGYLEALVLLTKMMGHYHFREWKSAVSKEKNKRLKLIRGF